MGLFKINKTGGDTGVSPVSSTDKGVVGGLIHMDAGNDVLMWKYPHNNIKRGAVIKVHQNQRALLYANGERIDTIGPGREVVIDSNNMPFLSRLMNVASGGETTYTFEVWFANMTCVHNVNIGFNGNNDGVRVSVPNPYNGRIMKFPVNAHGSYRFKLHNPEIFADKIVGTKGQINTENVDNMFADQIKGIIIDKVKHVLNHDNMDIDSFLGGSNEMNATLREESNRDLRDSYGIEIDNFSLRFNSPEYDEFNESGLKGAKLENEMGQRGRFYDTERQKDIMMQAAANPGAGTFMGVGMGFGMGNQMGQMMGQMAGQMAPPPPVPTAKTWHIVMSGQAAGPFDMATLGAYVAQGVVTPATMVWSQGMPGWSEARMVPELASLFVAPPVPPVPQTPPAPPTGGV